MNKLKLFFNKPEVFHGFLSGILLLAVKLVCYLTNHWEYRWGPTYQVLSFGIILLAVFMASIPQKRNLEIEFKYKQALISALLVTILCVFVAVFAEFILYKVVDTSLADQTKAIKRETLIEGFKQTNVFSNDMKDKILEENEKIQYDSTWVLFNNFMGGIFTNGILMLLIALFTRRKAPKNEWLQSKD